MQKKHVSGDLGSYLRHGLFAHVSDDYLRTREKKFTLAYNLTSASLADSNPTRPSLLVVPFSLFLFPSLSGSNPQCSPRTQRQCLDQARGLQWRLDQAQGPWRQRDSGARGWLLAGVGHGGVKATTATPKYQRAGSDCG